MLIHAIHTYGRLTLVRLHIFSTHINLVIMFISRCVLWVFIVFASCLSPELQRLYVKANTNTTNVVTTTQAYRTFSTDPKQVIEN